MSGFSGYTIVVPVDFSDESIAAIETALEIADQPSQIHVVHVLSDLETTGPILIRGALDNTSRKERATQALQQRLADAKYNGVQRVIEFGDPGQRIVHFAESIQADLIVTPSHGRTGLKPCPYPHLYLQFKPACERCCLDEIV
jgi:nucleotide-binding universal stress UspA family protein